MDKIDPRKLGDLPEELSQPALRALTAAGYFRLEQLTRITEEELIALHGIGPRAMDLLRSAMRERGLSFSKYKKMA